MFRGRIRLAAGLVITAFGCAMTATAQPVADRQEPAAISSVQQLLQSKADGAFKAGVPVRLRGVVTYPNSRRVHFFLQSSNAGTIVSLNDTNLCPEFGQEVEVEGVSAEQSGIAGAVASSVRVLGKANLPSPRQVTVGDAAAIRYLAEWVELEGVVLQVRTNTVGAVALHVTDGRDWAVCVLSRSIPGLPLEIAPGARIRLRGVNTGPTSSAVVTRDPALLTVLSPGRTNSFGAPLTNSAALVQHGVNSGNRVRLRATVLEASRDGLVFLRQDSIPFQADYLYPFPARDNEWVALSMWTIPALRRGDVVEVVGSPDAANGRLRMRYSEFRVLKGGDEPEPVVKDASSILAGRAANDLVKLQGRVIDYSHVNISGKWFETFRLNSDGVFIDAFMEAGRTNRLSFLKREDLVEAIGIAQPEDGVPPYRLRVRGVGDVRSLGLDPAVARKRMLQRTGIAAAVLLIAGIWILSLRNRLVRERQLAAERERADAAVRDLNTDLSKRVAERTAELEQAKEELNAALAAERELSDLKTRFVALVSHEFRTPLGITMSAVELLRNYADRLQPEKQKELLDDIYTSTLRMSGLMEQVLLLGRVEAGKVSYQAAPLELDELTTAIVQEILSATNRRCDVVLQSDGDVSGALGDESLLRHIFSNLLSNAVKYSPDGATVRFSVTREQADAVFTVRDNGIGIPEGDRARLFEAFHRAANVGQTPGTGLGLLIVKRCTELHGGRISFESRENHGTTFTVRIPLFEHGVQQAKKAA